jgi:hypothetical protein
VLALQVGTFSYMVNNILTVFRSTKEMDPEHHISTFSRKTATGPLRHHLYDTHIEEWVSFCDQHNITITAADAQAAVDAYRKGIGQIGVVSDQIPYSKQNFEKALVDFIVGDDQVCECSRSCI